ncbi:DNA cytosine methyltransferase [Limnoraphis robusta]|uniref:DNA (cytosine-5-)-methyltransferase n=1 Tax=Limnoraphis robusta CCNP1315 TaxID=3110306 RepID=A0ABU5TUL4_9CYAN|nr:DNA cytosine methyltransferase [Limnoraphis robusta]MEA5518588.1 DNA cytosine methyltransferase [Limnoraphis robusta CCNP1315]MEA5548017.1 DNA cytosine methyltransferase [Limnoraphis robusta CCNP1324]
MNSYIFSFFSGAGFLDLGFEKSGFKIAYVSDINPTFIKAYRYSRKCLQLPEPEYGCNSGENADIVQLTEGEKALRLWELVQDARKQSELIGFIGGPPCPDFSVGGKNRGKNGENGRLSDTYIELIIQQKPDFFLFENVKGLYKTQKHKMFFELLKEKLVQAGYVLTERLINALEYGVPQDRDRIILLGFRKNIITDLGIKIKKADFLPEGLFPWEKYMSYSRTDIFNYSWPTISPFEENSVILCPDGIPENLTVENWFRKNDVLNHPNAENHFQPRAGIKRILSVDEGDDSKKSYKRLHRWRYSPTACYGNNEVHLHPYKVRRLSVAETLAIQSLPKEYALPQELSLSSMFKMIGNGVPYLASKGIATTIKQFLTGYSQQTSEQLELPMTTLSNLCII